MSDLITRITELTAAIEARLADDEAAARESYYEGQRWLTEEEEVHRWPDDEWVHSADRKSDARHIARHDPARVLRQVKATRSLVAAILAEGHDWHKHGPGFPCCCGRDQRVARLLAIIAGQWDSENPPG